MKNSLVSATKWLSSTAIRLFSSSDEIDIEGDSNYSENEENKPISIKRSRGRPRKDPKTLKRSRINPEQIELGKRRSSSSLKTRESRHKLGPNDGETRFLLSLKALPKNIQIIAKTLHPRPQNKYEEHRLACQLFNENCRLVQREIFIPTFRKIFQLKYRNQIKKDLSKEEKMSDEDFLQRHRPFELAERRERKREEELIRYELYMRKLSIEYPELLNRKYPITSDGSFSSIDR